MRESPHGSVTERSRKVASGLDRLVSVSTAERSFVTGLRIVSAVSEGTLVPHGSTPNLVHARK